MFLSPFFSKIFLKYHLKTPTYTLCQLSTGKMSKPGQVVNLSVPYFPICKMTATALTLQIVYVKHSAKYLA